MLADVSRGETAVSRTQLRLNFGPAGANVVKKERTGGNEWERRGPIRLGVDGCVDIWWMDKT